MMCLSQMVVQKEWQSGKVSLERCFRTGYTTAIGKHHDVIQPGSEGSTDISPVPMFHPSLGPTRTILKQLPP